MLTALFACFVIAALGYALGGIKIKGISLGTAGVLVMALVYGILMSAFGKTGEDGALTTAFTVGSKTVTLYNNTIKSTFSTISSLGTAMFVTAVGLIAGPKFFRNFNKKMVGYLLMGVIVILSGVAVTVAVIKLFNTDSSMALGLMTGALTSTPGLSAAKEAVADMGGNVDLAFADGTSIDFESPAVDVRNLVFGCDLSLWYAPVPAKGGLGGIFAYDGEVEGFDQKEWTVTGGPRVRGKLGVVNEPGLIALDYKKNGFSVLVR